MKVLKKRSTAGRRSQSPTASTSTHQSTSRQFKDVRVFTIHRDRDEPSLGFSVRGGSEHGLSIYISDIDDGSAAETCGLQVGDKILEVNNITLRGVVSSSAAKLLTGSRRLKLVIERTRKVPEWRLSREKTSWYDVHERKLISGEFEECGISHHIRGLDVEVPERRINVKFSRSDKTLGFNIRGGREYGLGIYVSKVDRGGLANTSGVRVGDQIIDVNGVPFDNITHAHAVEVMKGKKHLILTLRDVGRFPVFKELYAEYTWSNGEIKGASSATSLRDIHVVNGNMPNKSASVADLFSNTKFPSALQTEIFLPNQRTPTKAHIPSIGGIDTHEDEDSLIDLEQWGHDLRDTDWEHPVNRDVPNGELQSDVVVHAYQPGTSHSEIQNLDKSNPKNGSVESLDTANRLEISHGIYDTPDMVYAKIDKHKHSSTEHLNTNIHSDDDTDRYSRRSSRSGAEDSLHNAGCELLTLHRNHAMSDSHLSLVPDTVSTGSIDGALYSQVRRLSGSLGSPFGSNMSLKDCLQENKTFANNDIVLRSRQIANTDSEEESEVEDGYNLTRCSDTNSQIYCTADSVRQRANDNNATVENLRHGTGYDVTMMDSVGHRAGYDISTADVERTRDTSITGNLDMGELEQRLEDLQRRQTQLGSHALETLVPTGTSEAESTSGTIRKKGGKWTSFKNKIKGSLRLKSPKRLTISQKATDDVVVATGMPRNLKIDPIHMATLEEEARKLLREDEFNAVFRHIKTYHKEDDVDRLVEVLVAILDKPEKLLLLKDIRGVIYSHDTWHYDNLVNTYEIEAYQTLSMKLHLPLHHRHNDKPRKTLITTEIEQHSDKPDVDNNPGNGEAEDGHFHIKSVEKSQKEKQVVDVIKDEVGKGKRKHTTHVNIADEKSALEHFEYLEFEHSEEGSSIAAFSDYGSHGSSEMEKIPGSVVVHLSKNKHAIGVDLVEEVVNGEREVKISRIHDDGAANDDSTIEVGMALLCVDRHKVEGMSRQEVLAVIEKSYLDKQHVSMKLVLHKPQSTDF